MAGGRHAWSELDRVHGKGTVAGYLDVRRSRSPENVKKESPRPHAGGGAGKGFVVLRPSLRSLEPPRAPLLEALLAVDGSRPIGLEGHLRLLPAIGADHVVHLPGPAVEPPAATASVSVHFSNSLCRPL